MRSAQASVAEKKTIWTFESERPIGRKWKTVNHI
jgi:hypothetical protein